MWETSSRGEKSAGILSFYFEVGFVGSTPPAGPVCVRTKCTGLLKWVLKKLKFFIGTFAFD